MIPTLYLAILMILVAVVSRILPHPPNFNPLLAVSLFSGAFLADRKLAYFVPLVAIFLSDLYLGLHDLIPVIYLTIACVVFLGTRLKKQVTAPKTIGFAIGSSVLFFITTNIGVWLTSGRYTLDFPGFLSCFTLAIPFFQNSIMGDLIYSGVLFGSMFFLEKKILAPKNVTVATVSH